MINNLLLIFCLICLTMQIIVVISVYFIWKKDCKEIGKENLAVSLGERLIVSFIVFPFWIAIIFMFGY